MKGNNLKALFRQWKYWWKVRRYGKNTRSITREAEKALHIIGLMQGLEADGLLAMDKESGKVFIASIVARLYLLSDSDWKNFIDNVRLWALYSESSDEWDRVFRTAEQEAVRRLKKSGKHYTLDELYQVRLDARNEVSPDAVSAPELKPLEFILCTTLTDPLQAEIIAVGRWDGSQMDFTSFTLVRHAMGFSEGDVVS